MPPGEHLQVYTFNFNIQSWCDTKPRSVE